MADTCYDCGAALLTGYDCRKCDHEFCSDCRIPAYHDCSGSVDDGGFSPGLSNFSVGDHLFALTIGICGGFIVWDSAGILGFVVGFALMAPIGYFRMWWQNR